ncbi:MAG: type-F conjugative transfer system pilin assembly protein TraF [Alphaproteobacteria bacterium]|nr:type-F conjugative transfer system pilin assembly protein TraF [Alphaproteobacteria bacterium]
MVYKSSLFGLLLNLQLLATSLHAGFFNEQAQGWHWYEALPLEDFLEDNKPEEKASSSSSNTPLKPKTSTELVKAYRQELERRLTEAWIKPTPQNLKAYQDMQKDMMARSEKFSNTWMQVVYENPSLDHTLIAPVNQKARHVYLDEEKKHNKETIKALSERYGLFFFFRGDCPYCHQFAPIVKTFSETYGWEVIAISQDGEPLEEFPESQPDNGLFAAWKIEVLPSLYAVNPNTGHVLPIAIGLTSLDQMEVRIMSLVQKMPGGSQ